MEKLVYKSKKGNPVTSSLLVAGRFCKEHKNVIQSIENLMAENSAVKNLFVKSSYKVRGKDYPMYIMNRDGFTLLVMGFTGTDALRFKIEYIEAFNKMEQQLKSLSNPANFTRLQLLEMAIESEKKVLSLQPKADYADRVIDTDTRVDIGQACKILKLPFGRNTFFKKLRDIGVFFKNRNEPKQQFIESGYFEMFMVVIPTEHHGDLSKPKITVTQKGLFWLAKKFKIEYNNGIPELNAI